MKIINMNEWWFEEFINSDFPTIQEKIEAYEKKKKIETKRENSKINKKKLNKFQSFLLNTTSMTDIKNYTWNQVQEILDYLNT